MVKRVFYIFLSICLCSYALSDNHAKKREPFKKKYAPPGTVWLKDSLFIDNMEVANTDYREFWYSIRRLHYRKSFCDSMMPDTAVWGNMLLACGKDTVSSVWPSDTVNSHTGAALHYFNAKRSYFRYPRFSECPVVGVSYYQAVAFCKWRTRMVNYLIAIKEKLVKWNPDTINDPIQYVNYSLPTKEEWNYADSTKYFMSNTYRGYRIVYVSDGKKYTKLRKYNMLGHVSEIISPNQYKGLNYTTEKSAYKAYTYKQTYTYSQPQAWLGFRCVCKVVKPYKVTFY